MELRDATDADAERVRELVRSAMTTSYALSPQQIDSIVDEEFADDQLSAAIDDDTVVIVAEDDEAPTDDGTPTVGIAEGTLDDDRGTVRWLFVDPEHRGRGVGTRLFDRVAERLRESGSERLQATAFQANTEGGSFFERQGFERVDDRRVDVADESLVEYVYVESSASGPEPTDRTGEGETSQTGAVGEETTDFPGTEMRDGTLTAPTDDGDRLYVDRDAAESGTEASFFVAYSDPDFEERFGYYCGNCGSVDAMVDDVGRIECRECQNVHATRSSEEYDDSYL
ncbi:GNAT family N-acetyltransferase [Halomicrococcus gelatinilyticus]|uniref:GNAT family N-acetyltransferase n=1 Tax=Halomicrococcus gelatinilyticus TaxID=1702103 RepID=UPI002E0D3A39